MLFAFARRLTIDNLFQRNDSVHRQHERLHGLVDIVGLQKQEPHTIRACLSQCLRIVKGNLQYAAE